MSGSPRDEPPEPTGFFRVDQGDARGPGADSPSEPTHPHGHTPDPPEGSATPGGAAPRDRRSRAPRSAGQRWAALGVASVLILALGIAIGKHLGDGSPEAGSSAPGPSTAGTPPTGSSPSGSASADPNGASLTTVPTQRDPTRRAGSRGPGRTVTGSQGAGGPGIGTPTATSGAGDTTATSLGAPAPPQLHTAKGICGGRSVVNVVSGAKPLHAPTGLRLLAGSDLVRFDVDTGTTEPPLLTLPDGQYVSEAAADGHGGIVALVESCRGPFDSRVIRIDGDGNASTVVTGSARTTVARLVTGGNRVWAVSVPSGGDSRETRTELIATDGSGDTAKLPRGLVPQAGWHDLIIGRLPIPGLIQIYDVSRHGIIDQIGSDSANLLVGDGFFLWATSGGDHDDLVHRYDLRDNTDTVIGTVPRARYQRWTALSPDGTRLVRLVPPTDANPRATAQHPRGDNDAATRSYHWAVTNLDSGKTEILPAIDISLPAGSAKFSPDSRWLIMAVPTSSGERILLYDRDLKGPFAAGARLPAVTGVAPLAVLTS